MTLGNRGTLCSTKQDNNLSQRFISFIVVVFFFVQKTHTVNKFLIYFIALFNQSKKVKKKKAAVSLFFQVFRLRVCKYNLLTVSVEGAVLCFS